MNPIFRLPSFWNLKARERRPAVFVVLPCCFFIGILSWEMLEAGDQELFQKDPVGAWQRYCSQFEIGTVDTLELIHELPEKERVEAEAELAKARQLLRYLHVIVEKCLEKEELSRKEKIALMEQLMLLRKKVQHTDRPGVGNLVLSCAISRVFVGIFFQIHQKNDASTYEVLKELLFHQDRCCEKEWVVRALIRGKLFSESDKELSLYDLLVKLANLDTNPDHSSRRLLEILKEKLSRKDYNEKINDNTEGLFVGLLKRCDISLLTLEIMDSTRLCGLCKICHIVQKLKKEGLQKLTSLEKLEEIVATPLSELSPFEKKAIYFFAPEKDSCDPLYVYKQIANYLDRQSYLLWLVWEDLSVGKKR